MKLFSLKWQNIHLTVIVMLGLVCNLFAQGEDIRFRHITMEQGLSQNSEYCNMQADNEFIWIGTEVGMNRYDSYKFTMYECDDENPNSLSNSFIYAIVKDHNGILWIGTERGLNKFDPGKEQFTRYLHNPDDSNSLSNNTVFSVCVDSSDDIWIGTEDGLSRYNSEEDRFIHYKPDADDPNSLSSDNIRLVYQDKSGTIWIGTDGGGLNKFDQEKGQFICYKNIPNNPKSLSNDHILSIFEDKSGLLWIGTDGGGINKFDRKKEKFTCYRNVPGDHASISDDHINIIYEDRSGVLWIGTDNGGLNVFNRQNEKFFCYKNNPDNPHSLSNDRVRSIYEDNNGGLWFGTRGGGINVFDRRAQRFTLYRHDPANPNNISCGIIWRIYEDRQGILWIGTDVGGLNRFDRKKGEFKHYMHDPNDPNSLSYNRILGICEDASGMLWIGTNGGGLNKFDRTTERFVRYTSDPNDPHSLSSNKVVCVYEDKLGILWIGTKGGGLNKFNRTTEQFIHYKYDPDDPYSLGSNRAYTINEDRSGVLWIGTYGGGLNKFEREKEQFIRYKSDPDNPNSISDNFILSFYEDKSGNLWIGTTNKGLNKFNPSKNTFTCFTKEDGLPDNLIYHILEDDRGNLWVSTNKGISKFNPKTEEFKNYDVKDGLQSDEFSYGGGYRSRSGEMFFGGVSGLNAFFPDSVRDNPHIPPVMITDFQIFNKSVPIGKMVDGRTLLDKSITETNEITLSYTDNVFSFEFVALDYVSPDQNQYAYMMEGLEKEWNYVSSNRRYATYTRLPPGKYVFRVKGSNNDDVWNEEGTSLKITIFPPFWKTWWFYTFCTIIIIVSTALLYRYRVSQLKHQKEEEERNRIFVDLNQVLKQGSAAVYRRGFDSKVYEYMGEGIRDITGYSAEEITVDTWHKMIIRIEMGDELKGFSMEEVFDHVRKGLLERWVSDYQIRTKTGAIRWVRDMVSALRDESGQCYAVMGIMFDITDRKLAEEKLTQIFIDEKRKSKSIQSTFFEHTADPILIFDKETHLFLDCNKSFTKNYGYSRAEIRTMVPFDLHPPEDMEKVEQNIDVRNIDVPNEYKHITKDGRQIDVEILSDETMYKGKPAWISIVRNITERKQAELKLRQLSEELHVKNREMETDLNMAREIQTSLLAKYYTKFPLDAPEDKSALQFSHIYLPTSTLAGDFFDIIPISYHEVGILICDVMGHGARASLLTFYLRGLIEELIPVADDTVTFIKRLNDGLNSIMPRFYTGIFATAFYCVMDIRSNQLRYTNAGHPTPFILRRRQGTVERLSTDGKKAEPAIGIKKNYTFSVNEYRISHDDIVLFYTDGLYEVEGTDGIIYGSKRLLRSIQNKLSLSPAQLMEGVLAEIKDYTKIKEFKDDVCMVTMHVRNVSD